MSPVTQNIVNQSRSRRPTVRVATAYLAFALLYLAYWLLYILVPPFHHRHVQGEDHIVEWITVAGFLGAAIMAGMMWRFRGSMSGRTLLYFTGWAIFLFVCVGEELSWGQRLFEFSTPESVAALNEQNEFNLHNLEFEHIHPKAIATGVIKAFGILLPLVFARRLRDPASAAGRYLPPLWLIPCFLLPDILSLTERQIATLVAEHSTPENAAFVMTHMGALTEELQEMFWALSLLLAFRAICLAWNRQLRRLHSR